MHTANAPRTRVDEPVHRRVLVASIAGSLLFAGFAFIAGRGGFPERRFIGAPERQWLVDRATGTLALADPVGGRVAVRVDSERAGHDLEIVQSADVAVLVDHTDGLVLTIDEQDLRLTDPRSVPSLTSTNETWTYNLNDAALVAVPAAGGQGVVIPWEGTPRVFETAASSATTLIAPTGAIWQVAANGGRTEVIDPNGVASAIASEASGVLISAVGANVAVLEPRSGELTWLGASKTLSAAAPVALAAEIDTASAIVQQASADGDCLWVGSGDEFVCVGRSGIVERHHIAGLQLQSTDRFAVVDRVAVVVTSGGSLTRVDLTADTSTRVDFDGQPTSINRDARSIWVDDATGPAALAINARGVHVFDKLDERAPLFAATGVPLAVGGAGDRTDSDGRPLVNDAGEGAGLDPVDTNPLPEAPVARADSVPGRGSAPIFVNALANDFDPDGDPIVITTFSSPRHGSIDTPSPSQLRYQPEPGFVGLDNFTYTIVDSTGLQSTAEVTVEVLPVDAANGPPIAHRDSHQAASRGATVINVLANDLDPDGDPMSIVDYDGIDAADGTVETIIDANGGQLARLVPGPAAMGRTITFRYRVADPSGKRSPATLVSIAVAAESVTNRPPISTPDVARVRAGLRLAIPVLTNDFDPDGDPIRLLEARSTRAEVAVADGIVLFTAGRRERGTVTIEYTVADDRGATTTSTVLVQVVGLDEPNVAPVTRADLGRTSGGIFEINPLVNDVDPDGDRLILTGIDSVTGGKAVALPNGAGLQFTPDLGFSGVAVVKYEVTDGFGHTVVGSISIIVGPSDQRNPPAPGPTTPPPTPTSTPPVTVTVTKPPALVDPPSTTPGVVPPTGPPTVPPRTDPPGSTPPRTTPPPEVIPANQAPVALDDPQSTPSGQPVVVAVLANDRDPEGRPMTVRLVESPPATVGRVELANSATALRFTPAAGFSGPARFTYVAIDDQGLASTTATVIVAVGAPACVAPAPIAINRPAEFTPYMWTHTLNVLDPSQRTYAVVLGAVTGGAAQLGSEPGLVSFTPNAGNNGTGSYVYTVRSPCGEASATVTIDVNRSPVVDNISRTIARDRSLAVDLGELARDDEPLRYTGAVASVGSTTIAGDGRSVQYSPPPGFVGAATIRVTVADTGGLTGSANINVEIAAPANLAPIAVRDLFEARPGQQIILTPLDNDSDPDGSHEALTIELVDGDVHIGEAEPDIRLTADGRGVIVDIPANAHGRGSFRYRAVDEFGARSETVKTAVVVNLPPNAIHTSVTLVRGAETVLRPENWKVLDNDGDAVEIVSVSGSDPSYAVQLVDSATIALSTSAESPDEGSITFVMVDSWGARSTSTVTVYSTN